MDKKGFTLIELLIAMVVGLVIMAAIYGMMNMGQQSSATVDRRVLTQQDVRAVLDLMAMEIRMASFNPTMSNTVWGTVPATDTTCNKTGLASSVSDRKGIQIATANKILIAMDFGSVSNAAVPDGIIGSADNEYITYEFDSGTGTIRRRVRCGDNETILGGAGSSTMVMNPAGTPVFQYFDAANPTTPMTLPLSDANISAIRRIRITIVADVETQGKIQVSRRTYSTDVLVRNHVLSP